MASSLRCPPRLTRPCSVPSRRKPLLSATRNEAVLRGVGAQVEARKLEFAEGPLDGQRDRPGGHVLAAGGGVHAVADLADGVGQVDVDVQAAEQRVAVGVGDGEVGLLGQPRAGGEGQKAATGLLGVGPRHVREPVHRLRVDRGHQRLQVV